MSILLMFSPVNLALRLCGDLGLTWIDLVLTS